MSTSEAFPFSVTVTDDRGGVSEDATITVLDGHDDVRGTGEGRLELSLASGLYSVQLERAGVREEHVCRHAGPTDLRLAEPARYSAVPATDTATSHEYYEGPAMTYSRQATAPPLPHDAGRPEGSLFLFVRAPEAGRSAPALDGLALRILDYSGREIVALDGATTETDAGAGWLAFHATMGAGAYVLSQERGGDPAAPGREMAIEVFPGWQTQIFMTLTSGLSFASASVLMGHDGFSPDDRVAQAVDAALLGLQNRTDLLPSEQRRMLLAGKFENPMLGLVGAHALLQARKPDPRQIETVLGNLENLLGPDAADVRALRLLAARRWGEAPDPRPFDHPPLLRPGLEAVLEAAAEHAQLVPGGGVLERIATARLVDSPWSTWRPVIGAPAALPEWVSRYVQDAAFQAARQASDLDVATAAAHASLPAASVARAYAELRTTLDAGPMRTIAMEKLVTETRREAPSLALDPEAVQKLFNEGDDGERIRALALMQGDQATRDFDVALQGISGSRSAFEQYHALRLAQQMVPQLDAHQEAALSDALLAQQAPGGWIEPGTDRWYVSHQLLSDLGSS